MIERHDNHMVPKEKQPINGDGIRVDPDQLLAALIEIACEVKPRRWECFIAMRIDNRHASIYHPRTKPLVIEFERLRDLDVLAELGYLSLTRMPSGARVFTIEQRGYYYVASASETTSSFAYE